MAAVLPPQSNSGNNAFKVPYAPEIYMAATESFHRIRESLWLFAMPISWPHEVVYQETACSLVLTLSSCCRCDTNSELSYLGINECRKLMLYDSRWDLEAWTRWYRNHSSGMVGRD